MLKRKNKDDPDYRSDGGQKANLRRWPKAEWSDGSTERFLSKADNEDAKRSSGDRLFRHIVNWNSKQFLPHLEPLNGTTRLPETIPRVLYFEEPLKKSSRRQVGADAPLSEKEKTSNWTSQRLSSLLTCRVALNGATSSLDDSLQTAQTPLRCSARSRSRSLWFRAVHIPTAPYSRHGWMTLSKKSLWAFGESWHQILFRHPIRWLTFEDVVLICSDHQSLWSTRRPKYRCVWTCFNVHESHWTVIFSVLAQMVVARPWNGFRKVQFQTLLMKSGAGSW